jgi:hypothetical protein
MPVTVRDAAVSVAAGLAIYAVTKKGKFKIKDKYRVPAAVAAGPLLVMALNKFVPSAPV